MRLSNFNKKTLKKVYKRLKKDTKRFTSLIVREPLDFLDFEVDLDKNLNDLIFEITNSIYHPQRPYVHLSPKSKGINRPTVVFDIREVLVYRYCIEQIEDDLLKKTRQKGIYGGIKISPILSPEDGDFYEKWIKQWKEYLASIENSLKRKNFLVSTDIASYFENINLLALKDLVRSGVKGRGKILNLLFYFLENVRFRYDYEVNTFNGLPQEDIDCSRVLAYYFLHPHDNRMIQFCKENKVEFYRFVDDMNIVVTSKTIGKRALKTLTESLRKLGLVASIEKTSIEDNKETKIQLFFEENKKLTKYEDSITEALLKNKSIKRIKKSLEEYYRLLKRKRKYNYKNWIKVLRRFYTLFSYVQSDILLGKIKTHLIKYPLVTSGNKLLKYLIRNQELKKFNRCVLEIIDYLYSEENLYPALESHLLEIFLYLNPDKFSDQVRTKIKKLSEDVFFHKGGYKPLSEYARAISCLLIFRFNVKSIKKLAKHYVNSNENDFILKKYLIFVSLTTDNENLRKKVLEKAKKEQNLSINRLVNFIEHIDAHCNTKAVKSYIKNNKFYVYKSEIFEEYKPIRGEILKQLIDIYSNK